MATLFPLSSSFLHPSRVLTAVHAPTQQFPLFHRHSLRSQIRKKAVPVRVAAEPPAGVELPKVEPKFATPFVGFTSTAEIWNSRACMIGLIGIFIVELILNKGILQVIGVDVGKAPRFASPMKAEAGKTTKLC